MAANLGRLHVPENTTGDVPANTADVAYTGEHIYVQCFPLTLYIAALGIKTVDYFSLDVEGNEMEILETIPFNEVDIKARVHAIHFEFAFALPFAPPSFFLLPARSRLSLSLSHCETECNDFATRHVNYDMYKYVGVFLGSLCGVHTQREGTKVHDRHDGQTGILRLQLCKTRA